MGLRRCCWCGRQQRRRRTVVNGGGAGAAGGVLAPQHLAQLLHPAQQARLQRQRPEPERLRVAQRRDCAASQAVESRAHVGRVRRGGPPPRAQWRPVRAQGGTQLKQLHGGHQRERLSRRGRAKRRLLLLLLLLLLQVRAQLVEHARQCSVRLERRRQPSTATTSRSAEHGRQLEQVHPARLAAERMVAHHRLRLFRRRLIRQRRRR